MINLILEALFWFIVVKLKATRVVVIAITAIVLVLVVVTIFNQADYVAQR